MPVASASPDTAAAKLGNAQAEILGPSRRPPSGIAGTVEGFVPLAGAAVPWPLGEPIAATLSYVLAGGFGREAVRAARHISRILSVAERTTETELPASDFNELLHELRGRELERLPAGARTVLSGGCAGTWYFDWFAERYPTAVDRHIGVEALAPMPDDLPENVEWIFHSLGDLAPIIDGEVDLLFAGQVVEHLWPDEIAGFLAEAHRVLQDGGRLVIDSPNRLVTAALDWSQPEHTVEFTVDEIVELLHTAGFGSLEIRGIWLCYDRASHRYLPLEPEAGNTAWPPERRASEAGERPEDSFVWWVEATREARDPDGMRLRERVREIYDSYRATRFADMAHEVGELRHEGEDPTIVSRQGEAGVLLTGPSLPMPPGRWKAVFWAHRDENGAADAGPLAFAEVTQGNPPVVVAATEVVAAELGANKELTEIALPFTLERPAFGVQFRIQSTGAAALGVRVGVDVLEDRGMREPAEADAEPGDLKAGEAVAAQEAAPAEQPPRVGSLVRKVGRIVLWPVRRVLDPRIQGLATQVQVTHEDLVRRFEEGFEGERLQHEATRGEVQPLYGLIREEIDAAREATGIMGSSLSDLLTGVERARHEAERASGAYFDRLANGDADDMDPHVANLLNYAASHQGFAGQSGLWFNPPISLLYAPGEVVAAHANERIAEVPYTLRALADLERGASVLDVGAAESTLAFSLAVLGYDVTALDLQPYPLGHPRLRSIQGRIEEWNEKRRYNAVICLSTIEHIGLAVYGDEERADADLAAMRRMHELTESGGLLVLTTPVGKAGTSETERTYERKGLNRLLGGWRVEDLTVVRRRDELTWEVTDQIEEQEDIEQVALITARRED